MTNFNTYDYEFLAKFLVQGSIAFKVQSIKRLTTLAQNDKKQFLVNSKNVLNGLEEMYLQQKQDINILSTFLLSEIILNVISKENQQIIKSKHLKYIIQNLGHISKPQIRKASHTCLLAFIKTYHNFDGLLGQYLDAGFQNDSTLIRQKSINSLQSIFMLQARYFNWKSQQAKKLIQQLTLRINDDNLQIGKASAQCLLSLCRTQGIKITANALSIGFLQKLKDFLLNTVAKLPNTQCHITASQINQIMEGHRKKPKQPQVKEVIVKEVKEIKEQKKETPINEMTSQNINHQRRLQKIKKAIVVEQKKQKQVPQMNFAKIFNNLNNQGSLKERTQAAQDLLYKIQVNKNKPQFEGSSKIILPNIIKMMKDPNPKIVGITLRILQSILDDVKTSDTQLASLIAVVIQKLGDQKISVRQMVAKVIKQLIKKTHRGLWIKQLLDNMRKNTNTFLKDQTLAIIYGIYQQSEVQDVDYPVEELLRKIVVFTDDPKTKVKIRTLDCLSQIVFKSNQIQKYSQILKSQMSDVFYQMFVEKVNKLNQQKQRKITIQIQRNKRKQQISNYRTTYQDKIHRKQSDRDQQKLNVSMDVVKKRVSQLKRHRNIQSTQQTSSLDNTQRTIDRNMQDVQIMLPSLYKKSKTNRFELKKKNEVSPMKTIQTKVSSDYLTKQQLKPLTQPQKQLKAVLSDLKNTDWKVQFQITNTLRRLIQFHPQIILSASGTNLHVIVLDLLGLIESLRSSVSKNALICLYQLIIALGKQIDPQMQIILQKLMKKSIDTNVFISSQVQKCLFALSTHATPSKVIEKLSIYKQSKNFAIKDAFINTLIIMKNQQKIRSKQYAKLSQIMSFFLNQAQQDLRTKAKSGLIDICKHLGDWYRLLRGKISSSAFKLICDLMTKAPSMNTLQDEVAVTPIKTGLKRKNHTSQLKTINVQKKVKQRMQSSRGQGKSAQKKSFIKVSQFPQQFNQMPHYIDLSSSSEWKKRIQATQNLKKLALQYPNQFIQYRSSCHFMDILSKQIVQPNLKVSINAMQIFLQIHQPLRSLIQNNLSVVSNSIFNSLSSNKIQVKQIAQKCTSILISSIQIPLMLPHLCHGILYALPKSRIVLVNKLQQLIQPIYKQRKQLLFKHVFPVLNKLMDQYKAQLMSHVVNLFVHMYDIMGNNMFSHISKFKEVRQLIAK